MKSDKKIKKFTNFALDVIKESEDITLKYFKKKLKPEYKENKSPVTIADFKCEDFIIKKIKKKFPEHDFYSEERGEQKNNSEYKWIIDPIDGTRNFMRGYPWWGTLAALEYQGEVIMGIISVPAMKEIIWGAKGMGCYSKKKKLKVSNIAELENAYCLYGGLGEFLKQKNPDKFFELIKKCAYTRGYGDFLGHAYVISGQAEIMVDPHVAPYDVAAVKICIEEAGGKLTDFSGDDTIYSGTTLATNGKLHDEVLKILNG